MEKSSEIIKECNLSVFNFFNQTFGHSILDKPMMIIDVIGDPHRIHFHLLFIFLIGISILFFNRRNQTEFKKLFLTGCISTITFVTAFLLSITIALILKNYTEVLRPFCSLKNTHIIPTITNDVICNQSFPSGHMILVTIFVTSFWPIFNCFFKMTSIILIILTAITRMASGAHYPIDLIGGLALSLPLALYLRNKIATLVSLKHLKIFTNLRKNITGI